MESEQTEECKAVLGSVSSVEPDTWDLEMLADAKTNPKRQEFLPEETMKRIIEGNNRGDA